MRGRIYLSLLIIIACACDRMALGRYGDLLLSDGPYDTETRVTRLRNYDKGSKTYRVDVIYTAREDIDSAVLQLGFAPRYGDEDSSSEASWWMMPAVSYNGNNWGRGLEPKGFEQNGLMRTYSYLRSPIPCITYSEGAEYAIATWTDKPSEIGDAMSYGFQGGCRHIIIWPEQELPVTYSGRDRYAQGWARRDSLRIGETKHLRLYVNVSETQDGHKSIEHFVNVAWRMNGKKEIRNFERAHRHGNWIPSDDEVWNLGIQFAKESLWAEEGSFRGFSIGLKPNADDRGWHQRERGKYEAGWCGQNISLCNSLLTDYIRSADGDKVMATTDADDKDMATTDICNAAPSPTDSRDKAITCLDCWAGNCRLPNGLFVSHFDDILNGNIPATGKAVSKVHTVDACNLGISCCNFIEAYGLAAKCGYDRPEYMDLALDALDFVIDDQQSNGCYGRGWTWDGECVVREGTVGAFLIPAMIAAYDFLTAKPDWQKGRTTDGHLASHPVTDYLASTHHPAADYLASAQKAYIYYMTQLREEGYTTAGALDTWCIDKESAISLLRAALRLRRIAAERTTADTTVAEGAVAEGDIYQQAAAQYLSDAVLVSNYLSTWLWHYNGTYASHDAFNGNSYDNGENGTTPGAFYPFGGTSVSVQHHHLDFYASLWVPEWHELSELTGDEQWAEKAKAIWYNSTQWISDGNLYVNDRIRPAGGQNEAWFQCSWGFYNEGYEDVCPPIVRTDRANDWLVAWPTAFRLETLRRMMY